MATVNLLFTCVLLVLCYSGGLARSRRARTSCQYDLDARGGKPPMLINQNNEIIRPTQGRVLSFRNGRKFGLFCHSVETRTVVVTKESLPELDKEASFVQVRCDSRDFYLVSNGKKVTNITGAACSSAQQPRIDKVWDASEPCSESGTAVNVSSSGFYLVKLGWSINGRFNEMIDLCIDEKLHHTMWTKHAVLGTSLRHQDVDSARPDFRVDTYRQQRFFNFTSSSELNKLFGRDDQIQTVTQLLGANSLPDGSMVIEPTGEVFLARGHLAANGDFVYGFEQDATFYFINVGAQFQTFNGYTWRLLEYAIRDQAVKKKTDLTVYTGNWKVISYPSVNEGGADRRLFIYYKPDTDVPYALPVPKYFWKVVHDPSKVEAAAFLGLNDVHSEDVVTYLCENRCQDLTWIHFEVEEEDHGHLTCCSAEDLKKLIPDAPDLRGPDGRWPTLMT